MSKKKNENIEEKSLKTKKASKEDKTHDDFARVFDKELYTDEKILKALKPKKSKLFVINMMVSLLPVVLLAILCVVIMLCSGSKDPTRSDIIVAIVAPVGLLVITLFLDILYTILYYKNTYYVVTNKRIISCTGVFFVEFKSLDYENILNSEVYISWIDKILGKKSGSIIFTTVQQEMDNKDVLCNFNHILNPEKELVEIQNVINKK